MPSPPLAFGRGGGGARPPTPGGGGRPRLPPPRGRPRGGGAPRRQRQVLFLYYNENYTMAEIGAQLGVDRTPVSRTLKRGGQRLLRCLRYGGAALLRESFGEDGAENLRPPIDKRRSGVR